MMDGLIAGRLYSRPEQRTSKTGKLFMVARMRAESGDGENLFVNVIAFDAAPCAALEALHEGDVLTIAGPITPKVWTDKQGMVHPALDAIAYQVLTAYHVEHRQRQVLPRRPKDEAGRAWPEFGED